MGSISAKKVPAVIHRKDGMYGFLGRPSGIALVSSSIAALCFGFSVVAVAEGAGSGGDLQSSRMAGVLLGLLSVVWFLCSLAALVVLSYLARRTEQPKMKVRIQKATPATSSICRMASEGGERRFRIWTVRAERFALCLALRAGGIRRTKACQSEAKYGGDHRVVLGIKSVQGSKLNLRKSPSRFGRYV